MHACVHAYIHTYIHTCMHTYVNMYTLWMLYIGNSCIILLDVDNSRGGAELLSENCYQTPPCKQRAGGKAGTGVVKYRN